MGCHAEGIKALPADEIRSRVLGLPDEFDEEERDTVKALHAADAEMKAFVNAGSQRFMSTMQDPGGCAVVQRIGNLYQNEVTWRMAGAETGLTGEQFREKLRSSSAKLRRTLGALDHDQGKIHREVFESAFPEIVEEWDLGKRYLHKPKTEGEMETKAAAVKPDSPEDNLESNAPAPPRPSEVAVIESASPEGDQDSNEPAPRRAPVNKVAVWAAIASFILVGVCLALVAARPRR
jgi:hypothetical protein